MAEFVVSATGMDFMAGCPPILTLEGQSLEEYVFDGNCMNVIEHDSKIVLSAKQLGLTDLNGESKFKVTVERVE